MSGAEFRPQFHPTGLDHALRLTLQDVRMGRWRSMLDLLSVTTTWGLWSARSQVLAVDGTSNDAPGAGAHPQRGALIVLQLGQMRAEHPHG